MSKAKYFINGYYGYDNFEEVFDTEEEVIKFYKGYFDNKGTTMFQFRIVKGIELDVTPIEVETNWTLTEKKEE